MKLQIQLKWQNLRKSKNDNDIITLCKYHYHNARNAISAGNVNLWLDCYLFKTNDYVWWNGLILDAEPFFTVRMNISSRFLYNLVYVDLEKIKFHVDVQVDSKPETMILNAMLVQSQTNWSNPNEVPIKPNSNVHIAALSISNLYFRFGKLSDGFRNKVITVHPNVASPKILIKPDWELKTAVGGEQISYSPSNPITINLKQFSGDLDQIYNARKEK